jgi:hypothetical protein
VITLGVSAMQPINTRDPGDAARAYLALNWAVTVGHRHRPRQGCTCDNPNCPAPGAHPLLNPLPRLTEATITSALETAPGASLIAQTTHFDAVIVPHRIGMSALLKLDHVGSGTVPCLVSGDSVTLIVLPSTGRYALGHPDTEVRTGPDGWIALPPSHGVRWDTPPWMEMAGTPKPLLHGSDVGERLAQAFKMSSSYRRTRSTKDALR